MKKTLILFLWSFLFIKILHAQTMHAIMVIDEQDKEIGLSCQTDKYKMSAFLATAARSIGYKLQPYEHSRGSFNQKSLEITLQNLQTTTEDLIVFYYSGHGTNEKGDYPSLDINGETVSVEDIYQELKRQKARLKLVLTDCCNNFQVEKGNPQNDNFKPDMPAPDACKKLFLESQGSILLTSSKKGEPSIATSQGSHFTNAFMQAFVQSNNFGQNNWKNVFKQTQSKLTDWNVAQTIVWTDESQLRRTETLPTENFGNLLNRFAQKKAKKAEILRLLPPKSIVLVYKGRLLVDSYIAQDYLTRLELNGHLIKNITFIEALTKFYPNENTYQEIAVQETWIP